MTQKDKKLLIKQATKLTTLGITVERERKRLTDLVERGVSYTDPQMLESLERFKKADTEWKRLEAEHLALKTKPSPQEKE